jgi:hypothetical protein
MSSALFCPQNFFHPKDVDNPGSKRNTANAAGAQNVALLELQTERILTYLLTYFLHGAGYLKS